MKLIRHDPPGARSFCAKCCECHQIFNLSAVYYVGGVGFKAYVCAACAFLPEYINVPVVNDEVIL